jgi:hypothetical protein
MQLRLIVAHMNLELRSSMYMVALIGMAMAIQMTVMTYQEYQLSTKTLMVTVLVITKVLVLCRQTLVLQYQGLVSKTAMGAQIPMETVGRMLMAIGSHILLDKPMLFQQSFPNGEILMKTNLATTNQKELTSQILAPSQQALVG